MYQLFPYSFAVQDNVRLVGLCFSSRAWLNLLRLGVSIAFNRCHTCASDFIMKGTEKFSNYGEPIV